MNDTGAERGGEALEGQHAIFGGLTAEEVAAGLRAEAAHIATMGFVRRFENAEPGSTQAQLALAGILRAQSQGDLMASIRLTQAKLEVADAIARDSKAQAS